MQSTQKETRFADSIVAELEQESAATKRLFAVIPEDKLDWRPHPKAKSLGELAMHVAATQGQVATISVPDVYELNFQPDAEAESREQLEKILDESLATAKRIVSETDDARAFAEFTVTRGGQAVMTAPRAAIWRTILLNHFYHHRGQLTTYLRQLDVILPSVYGPSADTDPFA